MQPGNSIAQQDARTNVYGISAFNSGKTLDYFPSFLYRYNLGLVADMISITPLGSFAISSDKLGQTETN